MVAPDAARLPTFRGYAFDLDGTVYLGDRLLRGAAAAVSALRKRGARVVFVTNKPLESGDDYARKLTDMGIETGRADVVTAVDSLVRYLRERHPTARLLTVAEEPLDRELAQAGFALTLDPYGADVVVVSFDRTFDYAKLTRAFHAARSGAVVVATNPDPYCPTGGEPLPDCAAMLAAVEACAEIRAEAVVGKPSEHMAETLLDRLAVPPTDAVVVGDRLATDVAMARTLGMSSVLVLSGATTRQDLVGSSIQPTYVVDGVRDVAG